MPRLAHFLLLVHQGVCIGQYIIEPSTIVRRSQTDAASNLMLSCIGLHRYVERSMYVGRHVGCGLVIGVRQDDDEFIAAPTS